MAIHLHYKDLPASLEFRDSVAVDTETMGLEPHRDRLCLVQLSAGDGEAHLVKFDGDYAAPNLKKLLSDDSVLKLYHFARFDLAVLYKYLGVVAGPVYCTKIAAKLVRTFTDRHGLKYLCQDLLKVELSKQQQTSDWGAEEYTEAQLEYAANDVLYLHDLKAAMDRLLKREGRTELARAAFDFLPTRAQLDLIGFADKDIFSHSSA